MNSKSPRFYNQETNSFVKAMKALQEKIKF